MKLKQELGLLAGAIDQGVIPTAHGIYIYLLGELFSDKIFKHKLSYEFVNLLGVESDKFLERSEKVLEIIDEFNNFKHDIDSNIQNLTLEELSIFDATSYHVGVKSTHWEFPTSTLQKYRDLVTKEQGCCYIYINPELGIIYFTDDKKEIGIVSYLRKKPERLF